MRFPKHGEQVCLNGCSCFFKSIVCHKNKVIYHPTIRNPLYSKHQAYLSLKNATGYHTDAKCCHDCANPSFNAQCPFTLRPKPSINIKNSIDNGSIDFSERGV